MLFSSWLQNKFNEKKINNDDITKYIESLVENYWLDKELAQRILKDIIVPWNEKIENIMNWKVKEAIIEESEKLNNIWKKDVWDMLYADWYLEEKKAS